MTIAWNIHSKDRAGFYIKRADVDVVILTVGDWLQGQALFLDCMALKMKMNVRSERLELTAKWHRVISEKPLTSNTFLPSTTSPSS